MEYFTLLTRWPQQFASDQTGGQGFGALKTKKTPTFFFNEEENQIEKSDKKNKLLEKSKSESHESINHYPKRGK